MWYADVNELVPTVNFVVWEFLTQDFMGHGKMCLSQIFISDAMSAPAHV